MFAIQDTTKLYFSFRDGWTVEPLFTPETWEECRAAMLGAGIWTVADVVRLEVATEPETVEMEMTLTERLEIAVGVAVQTELMNRTFNRPNENGRSLARLNRLGAYMGERSCR
jgi:hypothetical protein